MTTVDDEFLGFGRAQAGFYAFVGGPRPVFRVGVIGLGSIAGVRGRAGVPDGPQPTAPPFHGFAGVIGESRDEPGTAGTSVNNIGVYGQTQEIGNRAPVFLAGVYGTGNTRPGVVGWSDQGIGPIRILYDAHLNVTPYGRMNFGVLTKRVPPSSITSVQVRRSR